jgi:hypothetical protein
MTNELLFGLVILFLVVVGAAMIHTSQNRRWLKNAILGLLQKVQGARRGASDGSKTILAKGEWQEMSTEQQTMAEWKRLQAIIDERKQIARDTDISHHLWSFYKGFFLDSSPQSLNRFVQDGEWYDVKILKAFSQSGLNKFDFELKGARYRFVDDEENQGWGDTTKYFSLFLYDDAGRCLIEIPMKIKVDRWGRNYSLMSDGPKAFLPGGWVNDFINVKLKQQRLQNQEIREQKHQERLWEIEELKERFGIKD